MIDLAKLDRLRLDLEQLHAERRSLQNLYDEARQDAAQALMHLGSSLSSTARQYWRSGDDLALLLAAPAEARAEMKAEIAQAEFIRALQARMSTLQARMAPLVQDINNLSTLLRRLEEFAREQ